MPQMLLLNPAKRRKGRKTTKRRTAAQKRATAKMLAANRSRRRNPVRRVASSAGRSVVARRRNPIGARRRRRNPISLGGMLSGGRGFVGMFKDALISGAGAVAVDLAYGQVSRYLPPSLQRTPGQPGVGDAVKAVLTVALGKLLSKPTRGLSQKAAAGALTVQAHQLIAAMVPASMTMGYASPARIMQGQQRIGPNVRQGVGRFVAPGTTPLLSAYPSGVVASPLLNGSRQSAMAREGFGHVR